MASVQPIRPPRDEPPALHDRAMDNLRYIRETMERAGSFTAVSGSGSVGAGMIAVLAASVAARQTVLVTWVWIWVAAAVLAFLEAVVLTARKSRALGLPLVSGPGRKAALRASRASRKSQVQRPSLKAKSQGATTVAQGCLSPPNQ